jgi:chromosome segregation ATPase
MSHDAIRTCFDRFQEEVRDEIEKNKLCEQQLQASCIASLNCEITSLHEEKRQHGVCLKETEEKVRRVQVAANASTVEFRRKIKVQRQQHEASVASMAESAEVLKAKERDLLSLKATVSQLRSNIADNKLKEVLMKDAIDEYSVSINLVETEIENVRARNRQVYDENKKLKEKMCVRTREHEKEKAEIATFRPRMLDMADRMVAEYKKINRQIVKIDEKQKRIIAEKTAIIAQMQSAMTTEGAAKKRKHLPQACHAVADGGECSV